MKGESEMPHFESTKTITDINEYGRKFVNTCFKDGGGNLIVSTSQIRKFLSAVNVLQNRYSAREDKFNKTDMQYLRIKLTYQAGRDTKLKKMKQELDPIIARIEDIKDFKRFAMLMEAIVAYHKFYGGGN